MNLTRLLARLGQIVCALFVAVLVFFLTLAAGIAFAAWFINHGAPPPTGSTVRPLHLRHYVAPIVGAGTAFWVLLRCALSAGRRAALGIAAGAPLRNVLRPALFAVTWTLMATAAFALAAWIQRKLFGFFLPP